MIDFKQIIAKSIAEVVNIDEKELESYNPKYIINHPNEIITIIEKYKSLSL